MNSNTNLNAISDRLAISEGEAYTTLVREVQNLMRAEGCVYQAAMSQVGVPQVKMADQFGQQLDVPVDGSTSLTILADSYRCGAPDMQREDFDLGMVAQYNVVSDIRGVQTGGVSKTGSIVIDLDSQVEVESTKTVVVVQLDPVPATEKSAVNSKAAELGTQDFSTAEDISRMLKFDKIKSSQLTAENKHVLGETMKLARGRNSHITRLVKGCLYYLEACVKGSVKFNPADWATNKQYTFEPTSMLEAALLQHAAYVYLGSGNEPTMNAFLVAICKEYPLQRPGEDGPGFRARRVTIPADANVIAPMCMYSVPVQEDAFEASPRAIWSWMLDYTLALGIEGELSNALSYASAIVYGDLWPSIHLPPVRSYDDLMRPGFVKENASLRHLREPSYKDMLTGGLILTYQMVLMCKELRSLEIGSVRQVIGTHELWAEVVGSRVSPTNVRRVSEGTIRLSIWTVISTRPTRL